MGSLVDEYRKAREPLIVRAREIARNLQESSTAEVENALGVVRTFENQTRAPGALVQFPLTAAVGQQLGQAPTRAVAELENLAKAMEREEEWSKDDAERRFSQLKAARVEVEALPARTWTRFIAGIGSSVLASGSGILAIEEARIWPNLPAFDDYVFYAPAGILWVIGLTVLLVGLYYWSLDDLERRLRYEADFAKVPEVPQSWLGRHTEWIQRVSRHRRESHPPPPVPPR